jgi:hypothetical protein
VVLDLKKTLPSLLLTISLLFFALASLYVNIVTVYAKPDALDSVDIQVDHAIQIRGGGLVVVNDTVKLSLKTGEQPVAVENFLIGFPSQYKSNLDYCLVYETSNPDEWFPPPELDVGLGRIGFYAINVLFPEPIETSENSSYSFTVVFVFSNLVSSTTQYIPEEQRNMTILDVNVPIYPSLAQNVSICNVTVTPPPIEISFAEWPQDFNKTTIDSRDILNHVRSPLEQFTRQSASLRAVTMESFLTIEAIETRREITLDQWGNMFLSDFYHVTNKAEETVSEIKIRLPHGAYDVSARDISADLSVSLEGEEATIRLRTVLKKDEAGKFTVTYQLPWKEYVYQYGGRDFELRARFENFDWTIRKLTVTVTLPEGAEVQPSSAKPDPYNIQKSAFQETIIFLIQNATPFHDLNFDFKYEHLVFWASFRPTLWTGILAAVVAAIAIVWRAPKPAVPIVPIPPKDLRSFADKYGDKKRILRELELIEQQARRGKISRRRYRVRKRTLESRVSVLSRDLTGLRQKIRTVGPRYADIMRQIEVAETELEGVETDIRRVKGRYRRGEVSTEAYRRLLHGYHRRRDRAKINIDSALLRLREEIR